MAIRVEHYGQIYEFPDNTPQDEMASALDSIPKPEQRITQVEKPEGKRGTLRDSFLHGFEKSTIPTIQRAITGDEDSYGNIRPEGIWQNLAAGAGEYAPDLILMGLSGGTSALGKMAGSTALKAGGKELLQKAAQKLTVEELANVATKETAKKLARQQLLKGVGKTAAGNFIEGATTMGAIKAVKDPATQINETGEYDPIKHATNVGKEALEMGALESGLGLGVRAVGYPLRAVARGLVESQAPVGKVARIWLESEQAATKKQMELGLKKQAEKIEATRERVKGWQESLEQQKAELGTDTRQSLLKEAVDKTKSQLTKKRQREIVRLLEKDAIEEFDNMVYSSLDDASKQNISFAEKTIERNKGNKKFIKEQKEFINSILNNPENQIKVGDKDKFINQKISEGLRYWKSERPHIIEQARKLNPNISQKDVYDSASILAQDLNRQAQFFRRRGNYTKSLELQRDAKSLLSFTKGKGDIKNAVWNNADSIIKKADELVRQRGVSLSEKNPVLEVLTPKQLAGVEKKTQLKLARITTRQKRLDKLMAGIGIKEKAITDKALQTLNYLEGAGVKDVDGLITKLTEKLKTDKTYKFNKDNLMIEEIEGLGKKSFEAIRDNLFRNKLSSEGLGSLKTNVKRGKIQQLFGQTFVLDQIERASGVKIGHIPDVVAMTENRIKNISGNALKFINDVKNKYKIDGNKLSDLIEGVVAPTTASENKAMIAGREYFRNMRGLSKEVGLPLGDVGETYLPKRLKEGATTRSYSMKADQFEPGVGSPKLAPYQIEKVGGGFPKEVYERDAYKLMNRYHEEMGRALMDKTVTPEFNRIISQLNAMGRSSDAKYLYERYRTFMGKNKVGEAKVAIEDYIKDGMLSDASLAEFNSAVNRVIKEPHSDRFIRSAKELMYKAWITSNPGTILKQAIQPEVMGGAELGWKWMALGRKKAMTKEGKALIAKAGDYIRTPEINMLEEKISMGLKPASEKPGLITKGLNITSAPGDFMFSKLEGHNRIVSYLAAHEKMMKEGINDVVMETLTNSQKRMVTEAFEAGGKEAAADMFGKVMSNRINFIYSAIDKPEVLQGAIGEWIPFTTWSRNVLMRLVEDASKGNTDVIVKRFATAFAISKGIELSTGYQLRGSNPFEPQQMAQAVNMPMLPIITGLFDKSGMKKKKQVLLQTTGSLGSVGAYGTKAYKAGLLNKIMPKKYQAKVKEKGTVKPILRHFGQLEYVGKKK